MPAKDVKLLGSILTGPDTGEYKVGDESDLWQGVSTSCELILADRANIIEAKAQEMLQGLPLGGRRDDDLERKTLRLHDNPFGPMLPPMS